MMGGELARRVLVVGSASVALRLSIFALYATLAAMLPVAEAAGMVHALTLASAYAAAVHFCSGGYVARLRLGAGDAAPETLGAHRLAMLCVVLGAGLLSGGSLLVFAAIVALGLADFANVVQNGVGRNGAAARMQAGLAGLTLCATALVIVAPGASGTVLVVWAVASFLLVLGCYGFDWRWREPVALPWRGLVGFCAPLLISSLAINPLVMLVLGAVPGLDPADLLAFLLALNWLGLAMVLPGMVGTVGLGLLMRSGLTARALFRASLVAAVVGVALTLAVLPFLAGIYGAAGGDVARLAAVLVLAAIPFALFQSVANVAVARGSTSVVLVANVAFALTFAAALPLARIYPLGVADLAGLLIAAHGVRCLIGAALLLPFRVRALP